MLIKEYRIPLPMTVEEYRIAQLYMIAKKSREETKGTESGVEILVNEPYTDGPGGRGQFTHKRYHVGSHLPAWFKSLLPKSALTVEEEAWNSYPYTKTRFTCPFVEKFSIEIETYYTSDGGHQENLFHLSNSDARNRVVDLIDVVKDQDGTPYEEPEKEDPMVYNSSSTGRGPLSEDWLEEFSADCEGKEQPTASGRSIMCAYKLCKVEFRYWGMQSKIERFIHDVALRKTMLKAHLQAWVWQDEWHGLTMEDIRSIERETAELLKRRMRGDDAEDPLEAEGEQKVSIKVDRVDDETSETVGSPIVDNESGMRATFSSIEYSDQDVPNIIPKGSEMLSRKSIIVTPMEDSPPGASGEMTHLGRSKSVHATPTSSSNIISSVCKPGKSAFERRKTENEEGDSDNDDDDDEEEDDEFYDCRENLDDDSVSSLAKWSSMDLLPYGDGDNEVDGGGSSGNSNGVQRANRPPPILTGLDPTVAARTEPHVTFRRVQSMREQSSKDEGSGPRSPPHSAAPGTRGGGGGIGGGVKPVAADPADVGVCPTTVLILVAHGGSVLDLDMDVSVRKSDVTTFRGAFESVMRTHYPWMVGHVAIKCVPCPAVCSEALAVLSSLSPYSFDVSPTNADLGVSNDHLPVGTIPIFATASSSFYGDAVSKFSVEANKIYSDFLRSEEGRGFCGQICLVGDSVGAIVAYDALCAGHGIEANRLSTGSDFNINEENGEFTPPPPPLTTVTTAAAATGFAESATLPPPKSPGSTKRSGSRHRSPSNYSGKSTAGSHSQSHTDLSRPPPLDFDVTDFFSFGSPLGMLLAFRKIQQASATAASFPHHIRHSSTSSRHSTSPPSSAPAAPAAAASSVSSASAPRPAVQQLYNLFHPTDPLSCRLEPLLSAKFSRVPPINVPRYQKYPMGDGACLSLIEFIQSHPSLFSSTEGSSRPETPGRHNGGSGCLFRRDSQESVLSGVMDAQYHQIHAINVLKPKWWGARRIDYALYCPEGLANFPTNSLPHLFHSSYWESADVIAFILRQLVMRGGGLDAGAGMVGPIAGLSVGTGGDLGVFTPNQPREKWLKKRTSVKIRNGGANHRANDVIVRDGSLQTLIARFSYGPLDMAALTGEKVDIHIMKEPPAGDWILISTEVTDKSGRICFNLSEPNVMGYGIYPVRMVVRGDHTMLHLYLAVVPPQTETVVFSIDGSFAASFTVTGKDPKVKAGAVDIVRHWQELGYLIVYVTGRPDMQLQRVVSWLAQHNFPHGLVSFADGFTTDPLGHKADYLRSLVSEQHLVIHAAYGSSKDVSVYAGLGLRPEQIYIVGKAGKKLATQATVLSDGYAEHLARLSAHGGSRKAQGNARMVIPKTNFGLPGQNAGLVRRRTVKAKSGPTATRTTSYPLAPASAGPSAPTAGPLGASDAPIGEGSSTTG